MKTAGLFQGQLVFKCVEEATPLSWPPTIESLDLRKNQYPKLWSLFLRHYCPVNKATMVSSKGLID